ncbi:MAG: SpoIID/LytB domain-containing protein [Oscillospiraceae bacterium]|nr:SpoIID/LytB domain-containing protein [Oscillospiraceae bacterium]
MAANDFYVNGSGNTLGMSLKDAYAVGSGGSVAKVGDTYAITGQGVVKLGEASSPNVPSGEPDGTTIDVSYSTVRVAIQFGNSALPSAAIENKSGGGFKFGYYDSSRSFHEVASTNASKVTMVPDVNTSVSSGTVGCYHIKLSGSYSSFSAASQAAGRFNGGFPAYYDGKYYALVGNYPSTQAAQTALDSLGVSGAVFTASSKAVAVVTTGTTKILFEYDCGGSSFLAAVPSGSGKPQTRIASSGHSFYGGFEFYRQVSGKLTVINLVGLEDYVKGVLPYEMSASWPIEALKAQALAARTYFARNINTYSSYRADVVNTSASQVYYGVSGASDNSNAAVDQTAGQYVTYGGKLCDTLYYSGNGGGSEDSENVFVTAYPYLVGVIDPYEKDAEINPNKLWTRTRSKAEIAAKIVASGKSFGTFASMDVTYSDTNNAIAVTFTDTQGRTATYSKSACFGFFYNSNRLALPSIHFTYEVSGDNVIFTGSGWGHSVGMSQYGAYAMAKHHGFNYRQIIRFYYTGANISTGY